MSTKNSRDEALLAIRPTIPQAKISDNTSEEERFQNQTLRPILKLQHPIFIEIFKQFKPQY